MPSRITQNFTRFLASLGSDRAADGRPIADVLQPTLDVSRWYGDTAELPPGTSLWQARLTSLAPAAANHGVIGVQALQRTLIIEVVSSPVLALLMNSAIRKDESVAPLSNWFGAAPVTVTVSSFVGADPDARCLKSSAGSGIAPAALNLLRVAQDPSYHGLPGGCLPIGGAILLPPSAYVVFTSLAINNIVDACFYVREIPLQNESP